MFGRSSRIRTYDLSLPKRAHYQAVLYSVFGRRVEIWTPTNGFGDRHATITSLTHKKAPNIIIARGLSKINFFQSRVKTYPSLMVGTNLLYIVVSFLTR